MDKVSIWDLIYYNKYIELENYLLKITDIEIEEINTSYNNQNINNNSNNSNNINNNISKNGLDSFSNSSNNSNNNLNSNNSNSNSNSNSSLNSTSTIINLSTSLSNPSLQPNYLSRILDQRVQQSQRFKFYNPILGNSGYYHILNEKPELLLSTYSTPLHYAVLLNSKDCINILLTYCADQYLVDCNNNRPIDLLNSNIALHNEILNIFKSFKDYNHTLRRNIKILTVLNNELSKNHEIINNKLIEIENKRDNYKNKIKEVALKEINIMKWKMAISIVRANKAIDNNEISNLELKKLRKRVELLDQEKRIWFTDKRQLIEQNNNLRLKSSNLERDLNDFQIDSLKGTNSKDSITLLQKERQKIRELENQVDLLNDKLASKSTTTSLLTPVQNNAKKPKSQSSQAYNDKLVELQEEYDSLQSAFDSCKELLNDARNENEALKIKILIAESKSNKINPSGCCLLS